MESNETVTMAEPLSQSQTTVAQPARPSSAGQFLGPVFGCVFVTIYLFFIIFFVIMTYKFVRAAERIAARMEKGIIIKKEDSTT